MTGVSLGGEVSSLTRSGAPWDWGRLSEAELGMLWESSLGLTWGTPSNNCTLPQILARVGIGGTQ